jgi:hypothetical protein
MRIFTGSPSSSNSRSAAAGSAVTRPRKASIKPEVSLLILYSGSLVSLP